MTRLVVLTLALLVSTARADPKTDVTQAFASFIDAVATNKPAPVELFIVPDDDDPIPADLADTRAVIASSKLKTAKVVKQVFDALEAVGFKAGEGPPYDTSKFGKIWLGS